MEAQNLTSDVPPPKHTFVGAGDLCAVGVGAGVPPGDGALVGAFVGAFVGAKISKTKQKMVRKEIARASRIPLGLIHRLTLVGAGVAPRGAGVGAGVGRGVEPRVVGAGVGAGVGRGVDPGLTGAGVGAGDRAAVGVGAGVGGGVSGLSLSLLNECESLWRRKA